VVAPRFVRARAHAGGARMPWSWSLASSRTIDTDFRELRQEFTSAGAELWRYWRKKASFSFSAIRLWMLESRRMVAGV
jgi:hypothetical protein